MKRNPALTEEETAWLIRTGHVVQLTIGSEVRLIHPDEAPANLAAWNAIHLRWASALI